MTSAVLVPCQPIQLYMIIKEDGKAERNSVRFHVFLYTGTCRRKVPFFTLIKYWFAKWDAQTAGFEAQQTFLKRSLSLRHGIHHMCKSFPLIPTHGPPKDGVACWPLWTPRLSCIVFRDAVRTRLNLHRNSSISFLREVVSNDIDYIEWYIICSAHMRRRISLQQWGARLASRHCKGYLSMMV